MTKTGRADVARRPFERRLPYRDDAEQQLILDLEALLARLAWIHEGEYPNRRRPFAGKRLRIPGLSDIKASDRITRDLMILWARWCYPDASHRAIAAIIRGTVPCSEPRVREILGSGRKWDGTKGGELVTDPEAGQPDADVRCHVIGRHEPDLPEYFAVMIPKLCHRVLEQERPGRGWEIRISTRRFAADAEPPVGPAERAIWGIAAMRQESDIKQ